MAARVKAKRKEKCIGGNCPNRQVSRGLCSRCLNWVRGEIQRGAVTETELIRRGLMLPAKKRGRVPSNGLAKALAGAR